jgi:hypothetical protein
MDYSKMDSASAVLAALWFHHEAEEAEHARGEGRDDA